MKISRSAVETTFETLSDQWVRMIICALSEGPVRAGELSRDVPETSQRLLNKHLRKLEENGAIERTEYDEIPPRIEYSLTERGEGLRQILALMSEWAEAQDAASSK